MPAPVSRWLHRCGRIGLGRPNRAPEARQHSPPAALLPCEGRSIFPSRFSMILLLLWPCLSVCPCRLSPFRPSRLRSSLHMASPWVAPRRGQKIGVSCNNIKHGIISRSVITIRPSLRPAADPRVPNHVRGVSSNGLDSPPLRDDHHPTGAYGCFSTFLHQPSERQAPPLSLASRRPRGSGDSSGPTSCRSQQEPHYSCGC